MPRRLKKRKRRRMSRGGTGFENSEIQKNMRNCANDLGTLGSPLQQEVIDLREDIRRLKEG